MRRMTAMLVGLTALTVAAWGLGRAFTAEDKSPHAAHATSECAQACNSCQRECDSCANHCAHLLASGHKEHLKTLLESFAAGPFRRLSELETLTPAERHQAIVEWNDTAVPLPGLTLDRYDHQELDVVLADLAPRFTVQTPTTRPG